MNERPTPPAVEIRDAAFDYPDGTPALAGVTFRIAPGRSVCLAGPNGAGKSTLLLLLAGLLRGEGTFLIHGDPPDPGRNFGLVFQDADDQLFCPTVFEDVAFGPRNMRLSESEVAGRARASLEATGLVGFEERSAHHLSEGEKKRAAIAAVLACRPDILALDEPWANLDARGCRKVSEIIRNFTGTRLIASQDLHHAADVCDEMLILDGGRLVERGPMEELLARADLLEKHGLQFAVRCRFCPHAHG